MTLRLHNTLTKNLDEFKPLDDNKVTLYTCGPTVYDYLHVGNWTAYVYWDILVRTLQANDYYVERVMNITDVGHLVSDADEGEDKLEKGARRENKTAWEIAQYYTDNFLAGMKELNLLAPTHTVKATEFIDEQLELIRNLKSKGYTYQISDGIYFDTAQFPAYAEFARLDLEAQKAGARVDFNSEKRNPSDFALWKFTPDGQTRDMQWPTPNDLLDGAEGSVMGFPGWHLECSAMAMTLLGSTIDIHTGGIDHIPVHHTNEIAQSEAASGQRFVNYWLHCNHLKIEGGKISKSLGNGYTLRQLKDRGYSALDLRMFILQGHFQNEGNFTFENLQSAKNRLKNWRNFAALRHQSHDTLVNDDDKSTDDRSVSLWASSQALVETLSNNLDTPGALTLIDEAFSRFDGRSLDDIHQSAFTQLLETVDAVLGLQLLDSTPDISDDTKRLILERQRARDEKDWTRSDELRDAITKHGIEILDTVHGSVWRYA